MALQLDGVRHILRGMQQGAAIAGMLRRAALENEAAGRMKARMERDAEMADIEHDMKVRTMGGRVVQGGMVSEKLRSAGVPYDPKKPETLYAGPSEAEVMRPANKGQVQRYKTASGETREYELPTMDEQMQRDLQNRLAVGQLLTKLKLGEVGQLREMGESPGAIAEGNQVAANLRAAAGITASNERAEAANRSREDVAEGNRKAADARADAANKSREKAAGMRAAKESGVAERAGQKRVDELQAEHDKLHAQEKALWAEVDAGKERMKAIDEALASKGLDTKDRLALNKERREVSGSVNSGTLRAQALESQKRDVLKRKDALRGSGSGTGPAQLEYVPGKGLVKR